ncbi:hypothetical protein DSM112329_04008 [Paraconexibacter sp. AEG42_29]|uniref:Uncharacterized protein n=1 Tax=Paraconexibacter sp. AEG42_29 TaxID=2997339 RepID=A0AAU7B0M8_9ACTN
MRAVALSAACGVLLVLGACGGAGRPAAHPPGALAGGSVPSVPTPVPIGRGDRLRPGPGPGPGPATADRLPCRTAPPPRTHDAVHIELFAAGHTVIVPAGIGIAPPRRRAGAFVTGGRCVTPLRTTEPTGVIELLPGTRATLGDLFAVWGRALGPRRLLSFDGPVRAWVDGTRWRGPVAAIPLRHHAQIVVVTGPDVPVHATYGFPPDGVTHLRP